MKTHRIISFTIFNALVLMSFATVLASCEKKLYPSAGYFTKDLGRSIASNDHKDSFKKFQDPAQIFIYCELNSNDSQACYDDQLISSVSKFEQKFGTLKENEKIELSKHYNFQNLTTQMGVHTQKVGEIITPEVNKWVNSRLSFCKANSKNLFQKCMKQNIEKDTFQVLNKFHRRNKLNGQEYLYIKSYIQNSFKNKALSAAHSI